MQTDKKFGLAGKIAKFFIDSRLTPLVILAALFLGLGATILLPREEEPQISVPLADVFVELPGASAKEVEQRVTFPMEKLIKELPGVEYVYSTTKPGSSLVIVRFLVGQRSEDAIVRLYNKLYANFDRIPPGASRPLVKSRSIDDVPVLSFTLWSETENGFALRQIAAQLDEQIKQVEDVSETTIIGGQRCSVRIELDPARLASYRLTPQKLAQALEASNTSLSTGNFSQNNHSLLVRTEGFLRNVDDVKRLVVGVSGNRPIFLNDVATIADGPEEAVNRVYFSSGPGAKVGEPTTRAQADAVTISIAKRQGANAIAVTERAIEKLDAIKSHYLPADVHLTVTRNYGETAAERSNELLGHMAIAVGSVTLLMWFFLGRRESAVVAIAIPVTLALTLAAFVFYGFTLNRVTFFALIFSIGILVDDAIVIVENIVRHLQMEENQGRPLPQIVLEAVDEVGNPTILATFTVIAAILPMAFVGGLMGPYMRPIPLGASAAMIFSMLIAFSVVPWAAARLLKRGSHSTDHDHQDFLTRLYRRIMTPLINNRLWGNLFIGGIVVLLLGAVGLAGLRLVTLKMLPFDNKSELQVLLDMPEGTPLEETARVVQEMNQYLVTIKEVTNTQSYIGTASPYNFSGLVRHYFLRSGPQIADIQVNFLPKDERSQQSHALARSIRPTIQKIAERYGATIQIAEIPPGPPVLQALVTEVYGPDYEGQVRLAAQVRDIYNKTPGIVDVDWYMESPQSELRFVVDQEKAALASISTTDVANSVQMALAGRNVGLLHDENAREDIPLTLRLTQADRTDLQSIKLVGTSGNLVSLSELVRPVRTTAEHSIYHKNLQPVVYIIGDVAGKVDSPLYSILDINPQISALEKKNGYGIESRLVGQPFTTEGYAVKWDGEWQVTYEVFSDMGIAFAIGLVLI